MSLDPNIVWPDSGPDTEPIPLCAGLHGWIDCAARDLTVTDVGSWVEFTATELTGHDFADTGVGGTLLAVQRRWHGGRRLRVQPITTDQACWYLLAPRQEVSVWR